MWVLGVRLLQLVAEGKSLHENSAQFFSICNHIIIAPPFGRMWHRLNPCKRLASTRTNVVQSEMTSYQRTWFQATHQHCSPHRSASICSKSKHHLPSPQPCVTFRPRQYIAIYSGRLAWIVQELTLFSVGCASKKGEQQE